MIREMYRLENRALTEITVCRLVKGKIEGEKKDRGRRGRDK